MVGMFSVRCALAKQHNSMNRGAGDEPPAADGQKDNVQVRDILGCYAVLGGVM